MRTSRRFGPSIDPPSYSFSIASSIVDDATTTATKKPVSVLFACLDNIGQSPAAKGVFHDIIKRRGLDVEFEIDSARTIDFHEEKENSADPRMRAAAKKRGIEITSMSRPIRSSDFRDFDIILAMDKQNRDDILTAFNMLKSIDSLHEYGHNKVEKLMRVFECPTSSGFSSGSAWS